MKKQHAEPLFRFQIGAIKRRTIKVNYWAQGLFRFQIGAIKRGDARGLYTRRSRFDSKLVRLKD